MVEADHQQLLHVDFGNWKLSSQYYSLWPNIPAELPNSAVCVCTDAKAAV